MISNIIDLQLLATQGLFALWKNQSFIQYGYRKLIRTLAHGNSEMKCDKATKEGKAYGHYGDECECDWAHLALLPLWCGSVVTWAAAWRVRVARVRSVAVESAFIQKNTQLTKYTSFQHYILSNFHHLRSWICHESANIPNFSLQMKSRKRHLTALV